MKDKKIIVGVTGGIAAYKGAELVRLIAKNGADVWVAMTASATKFVRPLTFEALSGNRVVTDMWDSNNSPMDHISWGQECDLIVIAPATANFIGKMAHGIGDDFLSTTVIAASAKILVCPAMNTVMYHSQAVMENIKTLRERGLYLMEPADGELACGTEGRGRLPEPEEIVEKIEMLVHEQDLSGMRIMISAGPTVERIDPVRFITNRSSGKMGYSLARAARNRGAEVVLVSGPTNIKPPYDIDFQPVYSTEDMKDAIFRNRKGCDVIIKAAAVADYRPKDVADQKIKKARDDYSLDLVKNPDILAELGSKRDEGKCLIVGFAAETQDLIENARQKLNRKNVDMIVANDVSREDSGFESDSNLVKILYRDGRIEDLPMMEKSDVANELLDRIKDLWKKGL